MAEDPPVSSRQRAEDRSRKSDDRGQLALCSMPYALCVMVVPKEYQGFSISIVLRRNVGSS